MTTEKIDWQSEPAAYAIFAGGCFWCMQPPYDKIDGVKSVRVGYTGGKETAPDYQAVAHGLTSHREAVIVHFDPAVCSYESLLNVFWQNINPVQIDGQFFDRGNHYKTAIYPTTAEQKKKAEDSLKALDTSAKFNEPVATEIVNAGDFWAAEEYHQGYYLKNPGHYNSYAEGSGRKSFIKKTWGDT